LIDGVNGHLAPGNPPRAAGLAEAIRKCLTDPDHFQRLRTGAVEMASRFKIEAHLNMLEETFEKLAGSR
jgi:glycosyltransferase involved in cell wall biosynthesis